MIKCEVVFDGDNVVANGKTVELMGGYDGAVCFNVDNIGFHTLEEALKYCMEHKA